MGAEIKAQTLASTMEQTLKEVQYVQEVTRIWKEHAEEGDLYTGEEALRRAIPSWADDYKHHEGLHKQTPEAIDLGAWERYGYVLSIPPVAECFLKSLLYEGWTVARVSDFVDCMRGWIGDVPHFDYSTIRIENRAAGLGNVIWSGGRSITVHPNPLQPTLTVGGPSAALTKKWREWWFQGQEATARRVINIWGTPYPGTCHRERLPKYPSTNPGYVLFLLYVRAWWYPHQHTEDACAWCGRPIPKRKQPGSSALLELREMLPKHRVENISVDNEAAILAAKAIVAKGPQALSDQYFKPSVHWTPSPFLHALRGQYVDDILII